jgi:RimJ/RimL family protein N-acetyltransferase
MQPSQYFELGADHREFTREEGEYLAEGGLAWTAYRGSRIVGIAGFRECYTGHAVLWAALSDGMGADHLACTRFAKRQIADAPYRRLEAVVEADNARAVAWAKLVGLTPAHVLLGYGNLGTPHILFEKVKLP